MVEQQELLSPGVGLCFAHLLQDPEGTRIPRNIEAQNSRAIVPDDEETVQDTERKRRDSEEIHRCDRLAMISQEGEPTLPRSGRRGIRRSHRDTVGSEILKPSFSNSPWIRGVPQVGFSMAIRETSSRTSLLAGLPPPTRRVLESHSQYRRKPARCHATTVRGLTRISGFCHPDHSFLKRTQNSLC